MKQFTMIVQRQRALEVFLTDVAMILVLVLVASQMLVQQILTSESSLAAIAREFVGIRVEDVVTREIVKAGILARANVTRVLAALRVASLMIAQISLLRE